ncbi:MAG: DUF2914 domain-containing protein [Gammaproteobacteria bacterium]|nr:DUF2914 domain-containing protein [Gammaproteobacteria bacterium]
MRKILQLIILSTTLMAANVYSAEVSRAMFTTSIEDREPVIAVDSINSSAFSSISFFTELNDLQGQTITHQWVFNDKVMFEKSFEVNGARWRVWTSKTLLPGWTGTWTVKVLDADRSELVSKTFEYQ